MALRLIQSNDLVAYVGEACTKCIDLNVAGLVKNRHLAKSIGDAGWTLFRRWLEYFADKYGKIAIAVPPHNTSQNCSSCGEKCRKRYRLELMFVPIVALSPTATRTQR